MVKSDGRSPDFFSSRLSAPAFEARIYNYICASSMSPPPTNAAKAFKGPGGPDSGWLEYILTHYRGYFCLFFLLPLSALFEVYLWLRGEYSTLRRKVFGGAKKHAARVAAISTQVKDWAAGPRNTKLCTARPGWQTMSLRIGKYKTSKDYTRIKLDLLDVLEIDAAAQLVRVEPMVTMGQLTAALLPSGFTLPVLPELDDLTVGGLVAGVGIETSSHKYGLFQHICVHYELVLADGSVVNCSATEQPELFYAVPWSHGTLGFLTAVTLQIIPAKPYVKVKYCPYHSLEPALTAFEKESRKGEAFDHATGKMAEGAPSCADFVEALVFSPNEAVVMTANLCDAPKSSEERAKVNSIGHYYKPWFYTHVRSFLDQKKTAEGAIESSSSEIHEELIPLRHYYHRHTRSLFWEVSDIVPFGNAPWFRYLLGWTMPPKPSLLKITETPTTKRLYELYHVVQDMLVPIQDLTRSLEVFHECFEVYPLWLCPMRLPHEPLRPKGGFVGPLSGATKSRSSKNGRKSNGSHAGGYERDGEMFVDVGAYGTPKAPKFEARASCRQAEDFVRSVRGYQMMYADTYMDRSEFRAMFDHEGYDALRKSLPHCEEAFPEVFDKVGKHSRI